MSLTDYPSLNDTEHELTEDVLEEMYQADPPEMRDADLFDMFSHWLLVDVKKYFEKPWLKLLKGSPS